MFCPFLARTAAHDLLDGLPWFASTMSAASLHLSLAVRSGPGRFRGTKAPGTAMQLTVGTADPCPRGSLPEVRVIVGALGVSGQGLLTCKRQHCRRVVGIHLTKWKLLGCRHAKPSRLSSATAHELVPAV